MSCRIISSSWSYREKEGRRNKEKWVPKTLGRFACIYFQLLSHCWRARRCRRGVARGVGGSSPPIHVHSACLMLCSLQTIGLWSMEKEPGCQRLVLVPAAKPSRCTAGTTTARNTRVSPVTGHPALGKLSAGSRSSGEGALVSTERSPEGVPGMHSLTKPCISPGRAASPPFPSPRSPQQKLLCPAQAARLSCEQLHHPHPHHAASSSQSEDRGNPGCELNSYLLLLHCWGTFWIRKKIVGRSPKHLEASKPSPSLFVSIFLSVKGLPVVSCSPSLAWARQKHYLHL